MPTTSTLGYWKTRGLAQPIRLLLHYVGEEFEDVYYEQGDAPTYSTAAWTKVKNTVGLDFPNLPYYIDDDVKMTQSSAIMRHIGRKYNLMGRTVTEQAMVDMMLDNAVDFRTDIIRIAYSTDYEKQLKEFMPMMKTTLTTWDTWLTNNKWFAGNTVTITDFVIYEVLDQVRNMVTTGLKDHPRLITFMAAVEALPRVKAYMASATCIKRPFNSKTAMFK